MAAGEGVVFEPAQQEAQVERALLLRTDENMSDFMGRLQIVSLCHEVQSFDAFFGGNSGSGEYMTVLKRGWWSVG